MRERGRASFRRPRRGAGRSGWASRRPGDVDFTSLLLLLLLLPLLLLAAAGLMMIDDDDDDDGDETRTSSTELLQGRAFMMPVASSPWHVRRRPLRVPRCCPGSALVRRGAESTTFGLGRVVGTIFGVSAESSARFLVSAGSWRSSADRGRENHLSTRLLLA